MSGVVVTFSLDLMLIPCLILAKGSDAKLTVAIIVSDMPVEVHLTSMGAPSITNANGSDRRFFYNKVSISITKPDENLADSDFIEGRARFLLMEFQQVVVDVLNRLVSYFKYEKRHPNLRELSFFDLLKQEEQFCNPTWQTLAGIPLAVSASPVSSGVISIPGIGLLREDFFGISLFTSDESPNLERWISSADHDIGLGDQLLSDAQSAALSNNIRRAVLELVISIEVVVKGAFFKQAKIAGAVFEYLEDKGRETIKVVELLDGAASSAFGESFKAAWPKSYKDIDHAFRCRNKIAHRGEVKFRDDAGNWHTPDNELLRQWWTSTIEMFNWLEEKVDLAE